jgi:Ca2+-binding EF-hand superfamily protein
MAFMIFVVAIAAAALLAVGSVWFVHLVAGMRKAMERMDEHERKLTALRETLDDLIIGNVSKEDLRYVLRKTFDDMRTKEQRQRTL